MRDGGPGADPGNEVVVSWPKVNPEAADTTLWPGRAPTPVELLARGEMPPPAQLSASAAPTRARNARVTPNVPLPTSEQHTYNRSRGANPRAPSPPRP